MQLEWWSGQNHSNIHCSITSSGLCVCHEKLDQSVHISWNDSFDSCQILRKRKIDGSSFWPFKYFYTYFSNIIDKLNNFCYFSEFKLMISYKMLALSMENNDFFKIFLNLRHVYCFAENMWVRFFLWQVTQIVFIFMKYMQANGFLSRSKSYIQKRRSVVMKVWKVKSWEMFQFPRVFCLWGFIVSVMTQSAERRQTGQAGSAVRISFNENNLQFWFEQKI